MSKQTQTMRLCFGEVLHFHACVSVKGVQEKF